MAGFAVDGEPCGGAGSGTEVASVAGAGSGPATVQGIPRRRVLGSAAAGVGLVAGMLGGCRAGSRPGAANPRTVLLFQALIQSDWFVNEGIRGVRELVWQATAPFRQLHPGIDLRFYGTSVNPVGEVIAGSGPDVVQLLGGQGNIRAWLADSLLLDLSSHVSESNLNLEIFAPGALGPVQGDTGLYGLPVYTGTAAMVVNLGLLDKLGLPAPPTDWTHQDWADFARSAAGSTGGQPRYGSTIWLAPVPMGFYFRGWGGSIVDPADATRCVLDSPQAIACGEFLYPLLLQRAAAAGLNQAALFNAGLMASGVVWQGQTLANATQLRGAKWDFYPMPLWPNGRYTYTGENYYAIPAASRVPDAAWELLRWICTDPHYQRTFMHLFLWPPALSALAAEWTAQVRAVAPPLRTKNLAVFRQAVLEGRVVPRNGGAFATDDAQAFGLIGSYATRILGRELGVAEAFRQAANRVNSLEASAGHRRARAAAATRLFPIRGPVVAAVQPGR